MIAPYECTLANCELADKLEAWAAKLARSGGRAWSMKIPVDFNNDPDMLMCEAAKRLRTAIDGESLKPETICHWMRYSDEGTFYAGCGAEFSEIPPSCLCECGGKITVEIRWQD